LDIILNQFQDRVNFQSLLASIFAAINDIDLILADLATKRWLESATGVWLDIIGDIVGVKRQLDFVDDSVIFMYKSVGDADDSSKAFSAFADQQGGFYNAKTGLRLTTYIDEEQFRAWCVAKAMSTYKVPSRAGITLFCFEAFGLDVSVSSPITGLVVVTPNEYITNQQKNLIEFLAPIGAGITIRCNYFSE
jgi:hypothetical protein